MIAAQFVALYRIQGKSGKNDANDATVDVQSVPRFSQLDLRKQLPGLPAHRTPAAEAAQAAFRPETPHFPCQT